MGFGSACIRMTMPDREALGNGFGIQYVRRCAFVRLPCQVVRRSRPLVFPLPASPVKSGERSRPPRMTHG
jgi:hypothetical protein